MDQIAQFCKIIRKRSEEHSGAIIMLRGDYLPGILISILRQELDSLIRVVYLLSISDINERERLIAATLNGEKWTIMTSKGKMRLLTDKDMVDLSNNLNGWTKSVYDFGCAFIHLSNFHDYSDTDPFDLLNDEERVKIVQHLRHHHGGPETNRLSFREFVFYVPMVFDKISSNLECYVKDLETGQHLRQ